MIFMFARVPESRVVVIYGSRPVDVLFDALIYVTIEITSNILYPYTLG